ncbi:hypothetical protein BN2497_2565 [Janthinobacterium sp. CG23_2]|nr:hypothetical protein BN2497_41 [Janthinobacterium sp. CG23_2]CUI03894.1 hypothetical protein BN2497_2565 [Janthinobacterium sp. CG23_2]CUU26418.1 hypothetical protein BN3177_41 [Janthinobacterium sp. CG23_2]CUU27680.1 hypothetical protein BN3177_2565 [Janthinobacterium sp. CG23_2]
MLIATLDGANFTAIESPNDPRAEDQCKGCMFDKQRTAVCKEACARAQLAGLPDCESMFPTGRSFIYIASKQDPRQLQLPATTNPAPQGAQPC